MAIVRIPSAKRIDLSDMGVITLDGDIQVVLKNGDSFKLSELLARIEALETAYMEKTLLGADSEDPGTIRS